MFALTGRGPLHIFIHGMLTPTVEDYLREIHAAQPSERGAYVPMKRLATAMHVTPGTATAMARSLHRSGLVRYVLRKGVRLSTEGKMEALRVLRRHRLIELFLVKILGQDWADVHEDAHRLEHAVSQRVEEALDRALGHPSVDPHGDPIPGGAAAPRTLTLARAAVGKTVRIARIEDQSGEFLRFVARVGLVPDARATLLSTDPGAGTARMRVSGHEITVGLPVLGKIHVEPN
jgi:DtxR family Mn-dependent transcriptional regulator